MKKLPWLALCAFLYMACDKNQRSDMPSGNRLGEIQELQKMSVVPGKMLMVNVGRQLLVLNKSQDTLGENIYDRAIVLASENYFPQLRLGQGIFQADLYIYKDERMALLRESSGKAYAIGLDESLNSSRLKMLTDKLGGRPDELVNLSGYGLSLLKGRWDGMKLRGNDEDNAFEVLNGAFVGPRNHQHLSQEKGAEPQMYVAPRCDSGGVGAESCSVSSSNPIGGVECRVKCKSGYYACCNNATTNCTCVKETPPPVN